MRRSWILLGAGLVGLTLGGGPARAGNPGAATVEWATGVLLALSGLPPKGIPPALLQDAQGVAIIPHVVKAGFVFGGRYGRGVILVRNPDGCWSNPLFLSLTGGSVGWQV